MLVLPREEYDWFEIRSLSAQATGTGQSSEQAAETGGEDEGLATGLPEPPGASTQRKFFEYPGPLHSVVISPAAATLAVNQTRRFRALPRDRARDANRNLIVVNSGHRDFVFATRNRALQLRYLVRLYVKELVLKNFIGLPPEQVAERIIELSLYVEDKLKLP